MKDDFSDVTGVVLVGGKSRRMGADKALLTVRGRPLYRNALDALRDLSPRLLLVGGPVERFSEEDVPVVQDIYPGSSLGGLHAGLHHAQTPYIFALACDLPTPSLALIRHLLSLRSGNDVVVPRLKGLFEPLFAVYSKNCLPHIERQLAEGNCRIVEFFPKVRTLVVDVDLFEGGEKSFLNLNTPNDLDRVEVKER